MAVDEPDDVAWDDAVDVVCVGPGPAALAAAVGAAAAEFDVLFVAHRGDLGENAAGFLAEMTADIEPVAPPSVEPVEPAVWEYVSFSGPALLEWAQSCAGSPYGLLCTAATAADAGPLRVGLVEPGGTADLDGWLAGRAAELGIEPAAPAELRDLVVLGGAVAGVVIAGPDGESLVRADVGVVFAIGDGAALAGLDAGRTGSAELVVRSRPYSRFARLELLAGQDGTAS